MVLHPGLKLEYFQQHHWEGEWIEEAEEYDSSRVHMYI